MTARHHIINNVVVGYFELFFSTHGNRCKYTPSFDPFLKKAFPGPFGAI